MCVLQYGSHFILFILRMNYKTSEREMLVMNYLTFLLKYFPHYAFACKISTKMSGCFWLL